MVELVTRELYGGAMAMDVPSDMIDASTFRQVPDTQEVFVSKDNTDFSVIVDLLECVPGTTLEEALDEHVQELTRLNGATATDTHVLFTKGVAPPPATAATVTPVLCGVRVFEQRVAKFGKKQDTARVAVAVALCRLPAPANADILVTCNLGETGAGSDASPEALAATTEKMLHSLAVRNLSLFVS